MYCLVFSLFQKIQVTIRDIPFSTRPYSAIVPVHFCDWTSDKGYKAAKVIIESRPNENLRAVKLCKLLSLHQESNISLQILPVGDPANQASVPVAEKTELWTSFIDNSFVVIPTSKGIDTHYFWEAVSLDTIPVVLSSPLDQLYSQFPAVIVRFWEEIFEPEALQKFKLQIVEKWGIEPFEHPEVKRKISLKHWLDFVKFHPANISIEGDVRAIRG